MSDWREPWLRAGERVTDQYGRHVGEPADALPTPALIVDVDALQRNIDVLMKALEGQSARSRPHTKVQKSPDIALMQVAARALAAAGVTDILIANQVIPAEKLAVAAALAAHVDLTLAVDDPGNIDALSAAAAEAGTEIGVLVELDVGMERCGARSAEEALRLAERVHAAPGLQLRGIQAYEGHCMSVPDRAKRVRMATEAMDQAAAALELMRGAGLPAGTLSGGGTGTYDITGRHPAVTELQAGSYAFMDAFHDRLTTDFEVSLTVASTIVARHGDRVILDAGRKSIGIDYVTPPMLGRDYVAKFYAEEHAQFDVDGRFEAGVGDRVQLVSGYAPTTVNLYDVIFAVSGGQVANVWPVFPRGPGHSGFLTSLQRG